MLVLPQRPLPCEGSTLLAELTGHGELVGVAPISPGSFPKTVLMSGALLLSYRPIRRTGIVIRNLSLRRGACTHFTPPLVKDRGVEPLIARCKRAGCADNLILRLSDYTFIRNR